MPVQSIVILLLSVGVVGSNSLLLSPISVAVGRDLGVSAAQVMMAAGAYGLGVAVAALVLAPLADRFGADRALRAASTLMAAALAVSSFVPTLSGLILAQAVAGLGAGAALPAIYALAAEIAPKGKETRVIGAVLTGWTLSMVGGVLAAALIAQTIGWRAVYGSLAVALALLWLAQARLIGLSQPRRATSPISALRVPGITRALLSVACFMTAFYVPYFFLGAQVEDVLGRSTAQAGLVAMSYGIGFGLAVFADPLIDRLGPSRALPLVLISLMGIYGALGAVAAGYASLLVFSALWGVVNHLAMNLIMARLTRLDPSQRGAIMGLYSATTYACVFVAPMIGGALIGFGYLWLALLSMAVIAIALIEAATRNLHPKPALNGSAP